MCARSTRERDGIAAKLLRCGIASEALRRNMPLRQVPQKGPHTHVAPPENPVRWRFESLRTANRDSRYLSPHPDLLFLVFWGDFLVFVSFKDFLAFLSGFPFFSRDFRGSEGITNPCFFLSVFLAFLAKKKSKK